jgi:ankyrin repeat protein
MLVDQGADPSTNGVKRASALHYSAENGDVSLYRYLVEDCGLDIDAIFTDNEMQQTTPLYMATVNGKIEICEYLLLKGAIVDAGMQPLVGATQVLFIFPLF